MNPEMREVNGVLTPFTRRRVSAYLSHGPTLWFYHVSLVPSFGTSHDFTSRSAASFVSRHPKCRDPELLVTPYRNSRLRDFRDKSLDFLSSDMPKCRILTRFNAGPTTNFPPFRFRLRDFTNPDAKLSVLQPTKPRNGQQRFDLHVDKYATCPLSTVHDL
jgi:hypothetical protein